MLGSYMEHEVVSLAIGADDEVVLTGDAKAPSLVKGDGASVTGEGAEPERGLASFLGNGEDCFHQDVGDSLAMVRGIDIEPSQFKCGGGFDLRGSGRLGEESQTGNGICDLRDQDCKAIVLENGEVTIRGVFAADVVRQILGRSVRGAAQREDCGREAGERRCVGGSGAEDLGAWVEQWGTLPAG